MHELNGFQESWVFQQFIHLRNEFTNASYRPAESYYRKRESASYIVREVLSVRERERERKRDRRKWRHHGRAKIGDEFTLSLAKNSHNWRWVYTFPCQKFALFVSPFTLPVSPFTERSPLWRWNYRKRESASYIVREVLSVREREREIEKER